MSIHRQKAKRDKVEPPIIEALEAAGAVVQALSGKGVPDLLVSLDGINYLMEVKTGNEGLTEDQKTWHSAWLGQVAIVRTPEEALEIIGRN